MAWFKLHAPHVVSVADGSEHSPQVASVVLVASEQVPSAAHASGEMTEGSVEQLPDMPGPSKMHSCAPLAMEA